MHVCLVFQGSLKDHFYFIPRLLRPCVCISWVRQKVWVRVGKQQNTQLLLAEVTQEVKCKTINQEFLGFVPILYICSNEYLNMSK